FSFVIAAAASMGIPGFSGFAAEITILIGAWKYYPLAVWITGLGMVLVAAFTLRALKRAFFDVDLAAGALAKEALATTNYLPPITVPEKLGAGLLMFATLAVGIYPKLLLDRIHPVVEAMRIF